jgi:hypothetical protein
MTDRYAQRQIALLLVFAGIVAVSTHAQSIDWKPETPSPVVELENSLRLLVDLERWDPMVDLTWRFEDEEFEFRRRALTLGSYYRVHDNVKVGAFYRLQAGVRHDDDWIEDDPDEWVWRDTTDRFENVLIGDVSPRFLVPWLPGEDWVFMVKNRYFFNTFNGHQSLLVRPGFTYFHLRDREPVFNVNLAYGVYFSLNFGETVIYEQAIYLSGLYHVNETWKIELGASYERTTWTTSQDAQDERDDWEYARTFAPIVVSARAIISLDP